MAPNWNIWQNSKSLSVTFISTFILWLMVNMGILTVFTHLAQTFSLRFDQYAFISLLFLLVISTGIFWRLKKQWVEIETKDMTVLLAVIFIALLGAFVSLSMRRIGRFIPDEYYYGTNPAYYVQHPASRMDFKLLFFYSGGQPLYSVGYLTATAFDYILGVFSYLTKIQFIKVYYELGGGLGGFLIPLSIYLLLSQFSRTTTSAVLGTFFTTLSIFLLAETVWTPGGYSFIRSFEGKVIMLFAGIPLFVYYSLGYFSATDITQYATHITQRIFHPAAINLFFLIAALTGLSTSAFMVFPILAAIIFVSYWLTFRETFVSFRDVMERGIVYLLSFFYLFYFAIFVAMHDKVDTALAINVSNGYTDSVREYLVGYYNPSIPLTPILLIIFSLAILFITRGKLRTFLSLWMGIVLLTVPNPIVAKLLLNLFRGIYFRLMYIYPFPLIIGISSAALYEITSQNTQKKIIWAVACFAFCVILFLSPSSLFVSDRYTWGTWSSYKENASAFEIVNAAPHGLMVAPYPTSGAVRMIDTEFDQLVTRDDHLDVYLNLQGRSDEAKLRMRASDFLDGKAQEYDSFVRLMDMYPEVQSVVFYRKIFYRQEYAETAKQLANLMQTLGFANRKDLDDTVVFWK
ncbi:MAG: hypothetical protein MUO77_17790 [Anaerolineales bacterium]|nr:hypothetical protein [Anaerolineales bacterium]